MTETATATLTHVTSADGTRIAVYVSGEGRPLVVVPGTTADHTTWRLVLPFLEPYVSVHAVDRRGRGQSGDGAVYSLEQEYADVAAVVDAAAAATGGPVDLLGHSFGGNVAFGAATLTGNLRKLALYEGWPVPRAEHRTVPPEIMGRLEALLAEGRREEVLETMYRDLVHMSPEEVAAIRSSPTWAVRVSAAHTVPRELRAFGGQNLEPATAARIRVPVLLLVGSESPAEVRADPEVVAAALPDARIRSLEGQAHVAYLTAPEAFAGQVLSFLRE